MIKKEENVMLDKIEKLIVDGNKEVIERVEKKIDETKQELRQEIKDVKTRLSKDVGELKTDVKSLKFQYNTLDTSIRAVQYDVRELDKKLDAHLKVLHVA
jgi:chromosome segregation ATPase